MSDRGNDACWASCNVLLVLGILADGERAGHEIITILERQCDRTFAGHEGDLYPLLHRLEEQGQIFSREYTAEGTLLDAEVEQRDWRLYETYLRTED